MSKRAEQAALEAYPDSERDKTGIVTFLGFPQAVRDYYIEGYEQAEKDIIERACTWISRNYDIDLVRFRKSMEEEQ